MRECEEGEAEEDGGGGVRGRWKEEGSRVEVGLQRKIKRIRWIGCICVYVTF